MPEDEKPCTCDWLQKAQAAGIVIAALTGAYAGVVGTLNNHKMNAVEANQQAAVAVADDVREKLDVSTAKQEKQIGKVLKSSEEVVDSLGPQLWAAWRYARDIAADSGKPEDTAKAADAKRKYDEHVARQKLPKN